MPSTKKPKKLRQAILVESPYIGAINNRLSRALRDIQEKKGTILTMTPIGRFTVLIEFEAIEVYKPNE